ncbi:MAG: glycosyltransferase family 2 protein, partial [Fervidobacterium nodosum]
YNVEHYRPHVKSKFEDYVLKRLESGNDYLLDYILGEDKIEGIKKYGLGSLIFYFENFKGETTEKLKLLNEIRKSEDETLKGVSLALIGDTYLKMGNFKLALDYYKRSIDTLPELGKFIKPVLEDLKTKLDTEIDGAFEEIKEYYTKAKEFFTDLSKEFNVEELKKIYLISDSDFAKYVSSVYLYDSNIDKAKQFLEKIENKDKFYFYNFRLAKIFEKSENQEDLKKAYELHIEACKKNFNLADLGIGIYKFDGFYPSENIGSPNDEIVWVGNISEKHSGLGVISPIRAWKKANNYYYAYPFPKSEVLKVYKERLKSYKLPKFSVGMEDLLKSLNELNVNEISLLEDDEELKKTIISAVKEIGIEYKENSESIVSFELLNTEIEISKILSKYKSGLLFYFVPNFENKSDIAWYYPLFRVFRNRKAINDELEKLSIKRIKHIILTGHLRAVIFEK